VLVRDFIDDDVGGLRGTLHGETEPSCAPQPRDWRSRASLYETPSGPLRHGRFLEDGFFASSRPHGKPAPWTQRRDEALRIAKPYRERRKSPGSAATDNCQPADRPRNTPYEDRTPAVASAGRRCWTDGTTPSSDDLPQCPR